MADEVKTKKGSKTASLSAARRMLKEYQQNHTSKKSIKNDQKENMEPGLTSPMSNENITPVDSMASSTTSLNLQEIPLQEHQNYAQTSENETQNYFNTSLFQAGEPNHILTNYFDNLPKDDNVGAFYQVTNDNGYVENISEPPNTQYASYETLNSPVVEAVNDYAQCQNIHEDNQISEMMDQDIQFGNRNVENVMPALDINQTESAFVNTAESITSNETQSTTYSNAESLRQLSSQLTSLIDSDNIQTTSDNSELENRNQELAAFLNQEKQKTEQLNLQLREYMNRLTQLETENQHMKGDYEARLSREIGPLQEQLQYHIQTFGILVGEKTELTSTLSQSQGTVKQKTAECEELQSRLRASRHRVSELEKEMNSLKAMKENVNKTEQEFSREMERLKLEYGMLKDQYNEVTDEATEIREKLAMKANEISTLQHDIQEKNSQLSLAQLRIQQLTVGENLQTESQLETLNQQKISLEKQVADLNETIKLVSSERDQASQQYQQYVQQLNSQLQNLAEQLQVKNGENENLSKREQSLIKHIGELEKHLQQLQTERQNLMPVATETPPIVKELEDSIHSLHAQISELNDKYSEGVSIKEALEKELADKSVKIEELEFKVEQMMCEQPDSGKLLAAMESDKIAASRATEQNQKLKDQLAELQDGFVLMSNNKLELTEKLESEQHRSKELAEKYSQKESDFEKLHNLITFKDKEILDLEHTKTELNKQVLQQNQLLDRLRHYEAQGNVMELLQQELKESNKNLDAMIAQNAELSKIITELQNKENLPENKDTTDNVAISDPDRENDLSESIRKKIESLENTNYDLEKKIKHFSSEPDYDIKSAQYLDKENAMQQLEERFKKTMSEVADLTEEKQRLEHLVLQLQSETETIGEYITLYQCQRALLKQKTVEKDEQLDRLNRDRESMKLKLEQLNNLIKKLVTERGDISEDILNTTLLNNLSYCAAHKTGDENSPPEVVNGGSENNNLGTAGQIIALLSEIKTSSLVHANVDNIQNFHPCPCCSGKLLTV